MFERVTAKLHRCSTRWKVGPCWRKLGFDDLYGPPRPMSSTLLR